MKNAARRGGLSGELKALMLAEPRSTLAAAESMTAGRVQAGIAAVSGSSGYFLGGVTAYALEQKVAFLGVNRAAARKVKCVSAAVAEQMARGVCALFGSEWAVATTGYAEPSPAEGVMVPFAWWAVARVRRGRGARKKVLFLRSGRVECPGANRIEAQTMVAEAALAELVGCLRAWRAGPKGKYVA